MQLTSGAEPMWICYSKFGSFFRECQWIMVARCILFYLNKLVLAGGNLVCCCCTDVKVSEKNPRRGKKSPRTPANLVKSLPMLEKHAAAAASIGIGLEMALAEHTQLSACKRAAAALFAPRSLASCRLHCI